MSGLSDTERAAREQAATLAERERLLGVIETLANDWADQATDYDEDTEQQIQDGRILRDLIAQERAR